jgi:hypothetical protein
MDYTTPFAVLRSWHLATNAICMCLDTIALKHDLAQVEILAEGDHVNELMIVVSGLVEVIKPSEWLGQTAEEESVRLDINSKSIHGGSSGIELGTRWARKLS